MENRLRRAGVEAEARWETTGICTRMVVIKRNGWFRMCLVGEANKNSSGLDVGWDGGYWGKAHLCYWQKDWIKTTPGVWTIQHTICCVVLGASRSVLSSLIFKSPAQVAYFDLHAERSRKGDLNIQFCSEPGWPEYGTWVDFMVRD